MLVLKVKGKEKQILEPANVFGNERESVSKKNANSPSREFSYEFAKVYMSCYENMSRVPTSGLLI